MLGKTVIVLALLGASCTTARAVVTLQDRQQAACYNDAQRLCGAFFPDGDKIEACMLQMKSKVSPACRKFYTN